MVVKPETTSGKGSDKIPLQWVLEFVEDLDKIIQALNIELDRAINRQPVKNMECLENIIVDLDDEMHALAINVGEAGVVLISRWITIKRRKDQICIFSYQ
ncbi:uncharacterized protein DMAD_01227 [Drosophila madeirensis]|uniref:Uncharacterized protein n=1 Tax=Drosophila madeirensis TaxID=30013 RepID=A0AAU9G1C9_DROMD